MNVSAACICACIVSESCKPDSGHGASQDLEDRYNRLRLEVQLAADKGEAASEADLVRRAMAKEKAAPPVKGFFGTASK